MAPSTTRTPRYTPRRRRRSAGDLLVGLLAIAALLALTAGVPFALVTVFGLPVPHALPALALLTHQLDLPAILKVLSLLVWVAWIQLVWCVIAEVRAAVRNAGMPRRVPLAGGTQALVHRLVTTALLVFAATTALSPALAHQALAAPHSVTATGGRGTSSSGHPGGGTGLPGGVTRQRGGGTGHGGTPASLARDVSPPGLASPPQAAHSSQAGKLYVVKPPVGRFHESLWEIAQKYLGDGRRYREIFDLNKDRVQPDGSRLTIASLIRPGWVLHMPRDAHGPGLEVVPVRDSQSAADAPGTAAAQTGAPPHRAGAHSRAGDPAAAGERSRAGERGRGQHARAGQAGAGDHPRSGDHAAPRIGLAPRITPAPASPPAPATPAAPGTAAVRGSPPGRGARPSGGATAVRRRPAAPGRRPAPTVPPPGDSCTPGAPATQTSWPRPRSSPPGSWPPWAANAASNCGSAPSAAGWSRRPGGRRWPNLRCGPGRTSRPPGCWTVACAIFPARWPWRDGSRPPWSRLTSATRTWTSGWRPRSWTRLRRGPPWATARCGGCRSPRWGGSTWTRWRTPQPRSPAWSPSAPTVPGRFW